ncbi:hypothetical protein ABFX02_03G016700 [Erythranthe guttata]
MANFLIACILASWVAVAAAGGSATYAPSEAPVVIGSPIYAPSEPPVVAGGPGYAPSQAPSVAAAPGSEAGVGGDCSTLIYEMMECMSFLSGEGGEMAAPGEPCCAGFKTVVDANADCICYALGSAASLGLVINITRAAALPSLCRVSAPPISYCHVSLSPGGSPASSPPTASPVFSPPSVSPANSPTHGSSAPPSNSPSILPRLTPPPAPATSAPKSAPPPATSGTTVPPTATSPPSLAPAATSDDTTMPPDSETTAPPPQKAGAYSISPAFLLVFASFLLFSA